MSKVAISGNASGTGTLTIASPNTNSDYTLTLPQTTSTLGFDGPAFSASISSSQTVTTAITTQIQLDIENFDTASCYNNTGSTVGGIPAYSFLPNVAGYYQVNLLVGSSSSVALTYGGGLIVKNGTAIARMLVPGYTSVNGDSSNSTVVYMNGTTDYLSFSILTTGTGTLTVSNNAIRTLASAALIRGA